MGAPPPPPPRSTQVCTIARQQRLCVHRRRKNEMKIGKFTGSDTLIFFRLSSQKTSLGAWVLPATSPPSAVIVVESWARPWHPRRQDLPTLAMTSTDASSLQLLWLALDSPNWAVFLPCSICHLQCTRRPGSFTRRHCTLGHIELLILICKRLLNLSGKCMQKWRLEGQPLMGSWTCLFLLMGAGTDGAAAHTQA